MFRSKPLEMIPAQRCLPGRDQALFISGRHAVTGRAMLPPYDSAYETVRLGMGCFWGAERLLWQLPGVWVTAAAYAGGTTPNPTYEETCSGYTGHTEVVQVVYDPDQLPLADLLKVFWQAHDPTQGMRQGNDRGTQYRSAILVDSPTQLQIAVASQDAYQAELQKRGFGAITTETRVEPQFYFAEEYHQQYLHKNPAGYCGLRGTGVACV